MQLTCVILLLALLQVSEPRSQTKKKDLDPGAKAMNDLDKHLSHILEGQTVIYRKIDHFFMMQIGSTPDLLSPVPEWDWPQDLKKLDEKIFGRWKKAPAKKK